MMTSTAHESEPESAQERLASVLDDVAAAGAAADAEEEATAAAEAAALAALLEQVHPVLRYLDYEIPSSGYHPGGPQSQWRYAKMAETGIIVAGGREEIVGNTAQHGIYAGHDLVYTCSGALFYRTFEGVWSRHPGESSYWITEQPVYVESPETCIGTDVAGTRLVTIQEALTYYPLEIIASRLAQAAAAGSTLAVKRSGVLKERLESIRRVVQALNTLPRPNESAHGN